MAEKIINGITYKYNKLNAIESYKLMHKTIQLLGSSIEKLPMLMNTKGDGQDNIALEVIGEFFVKQDPDEVTDYFKVACDPVLADGEEIVFEMHFEDLQHMLQVVVFALQSEFGDFFTGGLAKLTGTMKGKLKSPRAKSRK